jgi:hypothetical protein
MTEAGPSRAPQVAPDGKRVRKILPARTNPRLAVLGAIPTAQAAQRRVTLRQLYPPGALGQGGLAMDQISCRVVEGANKIEYASHQRRVAKWGSNDKKVRALSKQACLSRIGACRHLHHQFSQFGWTSSVPIETQGTTSCPGVCSR